jgi:hypothetical protein
MNRDLRRLLIFLVLGGALVLAIDFGLGTFLGVMYGKMKGGERARTHYAVTQSQAKIYVLGSSRAAFHYDPRVLEDSLKLPAYNAGRPAQTVLYHLPVLRMILTHDKPEVVILDVNENEFVSEFKKYDMLNSLLPYYRTSESVRQAVDIVKPGYRYFSWSYSLPYNSSIFAIFYRSLLSPGDREEIAGYTPMKGHKDTVPDTLQNCQDRPVYDALIIKAFHDFVDLCRERGIRLVVVTSPRFVVPMCPRADLLRLQQEIKNAGVEYLDFTKNDKYIKNLDYMYDDVHLNELGATEFSRDIAGYLKRRTP